MKCSCTVARHDATKPLVEAFGVVRQECQALKVLLAPDDAWSVIAADASGPPNSARHLSYLLLAYKRGCLARITGPVHRFLFDGERLHSKVTKQYRRDLQERWLFDRNKVARNEVARHEQFKQDFGKVVELLLAEWLRDKGWTVTGLAALGAHSDVVAASPEQCSYSIEVKYIGQETADFRQVIEALAGRPAGGSTTLYGGINYLLFRVYEAAVSLRRCATLKLAAVVINEQAWDVFDVALKNRWLSWEAPAFLPTAETDWNAFLQKQRARYPSIDSDLASVVRGLDRVWIMCLTGHYGCSLEFEYRLAG